MSFSRTRPETCLSDLALDRLLGDALDGLAEAAAREHLAGCSVCSARLRAITTERDQHALPPLGIVPLVRRRRPPIVAIAAAAMAAAAGFALVSITPLAPDTVRAKGRPSIGFFVQHQGRVRRGADGEIVAPGDALRFVYSADRPLYLAIAGVDATGRIDLYHPPPSAPSQPEPAGREIALPSAVQLDDLLGKEELHALFCEAPIDLDAFRKAPAGVPPAGCAPAAIAVEKR